MRAPELKVVHILHSFGTGGMEKGVATLVSNASKNIEHVILCLTEVGNSTRLLPADTQIVPLNKPQGNSFRFLLKLVKLLKKLSPDVVHTRNWGGTDGIIAARMAGIRSIVHSEHGFGPENPKGDNKKRIWIHKVISPFVQEYICLSQPLKSWVEKNVTNRKPVQQIINGVDTELYSPGPSAEFKKKMGFDRQTMVIGIVASLNPIKDHLTLIRAFKKFQGVRPESALLVVGDGPERAKLEALSGSSKVLFLGDRSDVPDLMKIMDLFVLSSVNEGISNTIMEAMASGLPVAATQVGGNGELVINEETGLLFPSGDSNALYEIFKRYSENENLLKRHGKNGRKRAVDFFSVSSMVEQYERIWKRVAQKV